MNSTFLSGVFRDSIYSIKARAFFFQPPRSLRVGAAERVSILLVHIKEAQSKAKQGMALIKYCFFLFYFAHSQQFLIKKTLSSIIWKTIGIVRFVACTWSLDMIFTFPMYCTKSAVNTFLTQKNIIFTQAQSFYRWKLFEISIFHDMKWKFLKKVSTESCRSKECFSEINKKF